MYILVKNPEYVLTGPVIHNFSVEVRPSQEGRRNALQASAIDGFRQNVRQKFSGPRHLPPGVEARPVPLKFAGRDLPPFGGA